MVEAGHKKPKVLLVGAAPFYGRLPSYARAFEQSGCAVAVVDTRSHYRVGFLNRVLNFFLRTPVFLGTGALNRAVISRAAEFHPDLAFFVKPPYISPHTIDALKRQGVKCFSWYPDDIFYARNASRDFYAAMPLYDCHFTTKSFNVRELLDAGAKAAVFLPHAVDPVCHHPVKASEEECKKLGADVVFVGTWARDKRVEYLERLCREGYDIKVYGGLWRKQDKSSCLIRSGKVQFREVYCDELSKVLNSSKIVLAFLREHNRDRQTGRTYEIPACGAFMLHERTDEAAALFKEGQEAEFFGSYEEMKAKIDHYLARPEERSAIARAGHARALQPENSYADRVGKILNKYKELCAAT